MEQGLDESLGGQQLQNLLRVSDCWTPTGKPSLPAPPHNRRRQCNHGSPTAHPGAQPRSRWAWAPPPPDPHCSVPFATGHARVYVAFDVLFRYLRHLGYEVTYARNFTDVDDKIIARAAATREDPLALSARFIHEFHADMVRGDVVCVGRSQGQHAWVGVGDWVPGTVRCWRLCW